MERRTYKWPWDLISSELRVSTVGLARSQRAKTLDHSHSLESELPTLNLGLELRLLGGNRLLSHKTESRGLKVSGCTAEGGLRGNLSGTTQNKPGHLPTPTVHMLPHRTDGDWLWRRKEKCTSAWVERIF